MRRPDSLGIMINGSFVFGLDGDDCDVFPRTVDWAVQIGITTATFHILTPYPGTALFTDMAARNRIQTQDWDLYDTRHVVYRPSLLSPEELKRGYDWSYEEFYRWGSIFEAASAHKSVKHRMKHFFYSAGWKKFERAWDFVIRIKQLSQIRPLLEAVLAPVETSAAPVASADILGALASLPAVGRCQLQIDLRRERMQFRENSGTYYVLDILVKSNGVL